MKLIYLWIYLIKCNVYTYIYVYVILCCSDVSLEVSNDSNQSKDNVIEWLLNAISAYLVKKESTLNVNYLFEAEKLKENDKGMVVLFNKLLLYLISVSSNNEEFVKKIKVLEVNEICFYWNVVEMFGKFDGNNLRDVPMVSVNEFDEMKRYLEGKVKKLEKIEKDCKTIIEKHLSEVVIKENSIKKMKETIERLEKEQKQNEIKYENEKSEIDKIKEQNDLLQKEIEELKQNNDKYQHEIISLKESNGQYQQVIVDLNERNNALLKETQMLKDNTHYQQEIQSLKESNDQYQQEIHSLKDSNTQYQNEIQNLKETQIHNYKVEIENLKESNTTYQQQLQHANDNNTQLQQKISEYETTTNQQQTSINSFQNEIETLQKEIENLTQSNTNYQQQLQTSNETNTQYQQQLKESNDNTLLLQQKLSEYESTANQQVSSINSLQQELNQMRLQLNETSQQNQTLQNTITSLSTKPPLFISNSPPSIQYLQTDSLSNTRLPSPILTETLFELASKLLN